MRMHGLGKTPIGATKIRSDLPSTGCADMHHQAAFNNVAERDKCTTCTKKKCTNCISYERKRKYENKQVHDGAECVRETSSISS